MLEAQKDFPLFVVAGMPRSGTTFLYHNLTRHPHIFLPFRKEVNYFNVNFSRGVEWYVSLYAERQAGQVCGDISPLCFMDTDSIARIQTFNPAAKVILGVREPTEWVLSLYAQFASFTFNMPPLREFVEGYVHRMGEQSLLLQFQGEYIMQTLQAFMDAFGERVLLYDFTYFQRDTLALLRGIEEFLEIPAFFQAGNYDNVKINASNRKNSRLLSYMLQHETLIRLIEKALPRQLVIAVRGQFDRLSAAIAHHHRHPPPLYTPEQHTRVSELLGGQSKKIAALFADSPFILGTRTP